MNERQSTTLRRLWEQVRPTALSHWFTVVAAIATLFPLIVLISGSYDLSEDRARIQRMEQQVQAARLNAERRSARAEFEQLRRQVEMQLIQMQEIGVAQGPSRPQAVNLDPLIDRLDGLEERQQRLEQVIMNDPVKALEVPLLRRDLDAIRSANEQGITSIQQAVDKVYDLSKWLLGALVIGVLSLAISNFLGKRST